MNGILNELCDAIHSATEADQAQLLAALGAKARCEEPVRAAAVTPLPVGAIDPNIASDIEWV